MKILRSFFSILIAINILLIPLVSLPLTQADALTSSNSKTVPSPSIYGLTGRYYNGKNFEELKLTRNDRTIFFDWSTRAPSPELNNDQFSVQWKGFVYPKYSQEYNFYVRSNDGARLWVNGQLIIDQWWDKNGEEAHGTIRLQGKRLNEIKLEYYDNTGNAMVDLLWSSQSQPKQTIDEKSLFPEGTTSVPFPSPTPIPTPIPTATPTPIPSPVPTPPSPGNGANYTTANGKIYKNGQQIQIKGIGWYGNELRMHRFSGLDVRDYKDMIAQIKSTGFNAVRLPFCPATLKDVEPQGITFENGKNADLVGLRSLGVLDKMMLELNRQQLYIMFDHHSIDCDHIYPLWYNDNYSESDWVTDWKFLATRYKNFEYFMGADLKNEPHNAINGPHATWGTGNTMTDWNLAAERAAWQILAVNPNLLIVVEGIQLSTHCQNGPNTGYWWGGNFEPFNCKPIDRINPSKLILSPHVYGPDVWPQYYFSDPAFPNNMPAIWEQHFGFLVQKGYTVMPGEWGGKYGNLGGDPRDIPLQHKMMDYFISKGICNTFYWSWTHGSGAGGMLKPDNTNLWQNKVDLLNTFHNNCPAGIPMPPPPTNVIEEKVDYVSDEQTYDLSRI